MVRCSRCHRVLKDPESIRAGIGKTCYTKIYGNPLPQQKKQHFSLSASKCKTDIEGTPLFDDKYFNKKGSDENE